MSTILSAAWPSQSSGTRLSGRGWLSTRTPSAAMRAGSRPTRRFVPSVIVAGRVVHAGGPVQCQDRVTSPRQTQLFEYGRLLTALAVLEQGVDHHIADEENALVRYSLALEIHQSAALADEQPARDGIGEDAIDLLRHGAVEAAQARFDVGHRHA